ncbi:hypothetical protein FB550_10398 [Neobacillus bataviensis]|uniref:Uncharacterized protein n=1 Tax=Neobacillus bataviensis TaxID=220685 RepID=A0A561DNJ1_9BACI|nr:hypothetical protein [Neobacillus bataviensis]TWE04924.1 hypothetical protein FB550_10398 [Neobacillus bataviensis]
MKKIFSIAAVSILTAKHGHLYDKTVSEKGVLTIATVRQQKTSPLTGLVDITWHDWESMYLGDQNSSCYIFSE